MLSDKDDDFVYPPRDYSHNWMMKHKSGETHPIIIPPNLKGEGGRENKNVEHTNESP